MKKAISVLLIVLTLLSVISIFAFNVSAAKTTAFDQLTESKYAKTYTLSRSGRTTPYTSKSLSYRGTVTYGRSSTAYIDNAADELYVLDAGVTNGKAWAYVSFPIGSKRAKAYIPLSAISDNNANHAKSVSSGKFYCSYRYGVSNSSPYYVAKNDTVYLISTTQSRYQIMYPISGNKWRIGWCDKSDYTRYCTVQPTPTPPNPTASTFTVPMKSYRMTNGFGNYCSYMSGRYHNGKMRAYHIGMDYCSVSGGDTGVYAFSSGTVAKTGWNSANGNYVVIRHNISNKTVYSFYGHLNSYFVSAGATVSAGTKIGIVGKTGSSGNGVVHLHFAVTDTLKYGSYWGYATYFTGNSVRFEGTTYYNPDYIIKYGKLPS